MAEELKYAEDFLDPVRALELLREICDRETGSIERVVNIHPVKRRAGRRLTLRYSVVIEESDGTKTLKTFYGKLNRSRRSAEIAEIHSWLYLRSDSALRFPRVLGFNAERRFLLLEALPGESLATCLRGGKAPLLLREFGFRLAGLHDMDPARESASSPALRVHDSAKEIEVLEKAMETMRGASLPTAIQREHTEISSRVCLELARSRSFDEHCLIHRDLHPEQVLFSDNELSLIDLDEMCLGPAALDVGNFLAHLWLADFQVLGQVRGAPALSRIFLRGYSSAIRTLNKRERIYLVAALIRLASLERLAEPTRSRISWPELAALLMEEAGIQLEVALSARYPSRSGDPAARGRAGAA